LNATLGLVGPMSATLTVAGLKFAPNPYAATQPLQGTVGVTMTSCPSNVSQHPARTCGPTAATIRPGLHELQAKQGTLVLMFGSTQRIFPDPDGCSTGLIGPPVSMTKRFDPTDLLRRRVTTVSGTFRWQSTTSATEGTSQEHTEVDYTVRFTRLP
jgi:hypothetical protein